MSLHSKSNDSQSKRCKLLFGAQCTRSCDAPGNLSGYLCVMFSVQSSIFRKCVITFDCPSNITSTPAWRNVLAYRRCYCYITDNGVGGQRQNCNALGFSSMGCCSIARSWSLRVTLIRPLSILTHPDWSLLVASDLCSFVVGVVFVIVVAFIIHGGFLINKKLPTN